MCAERIGQPAVFNLNRCFESQGNQAIPVDHQVGFLNQNFIARNCFGFFTSAKGADNAPVNFGGPQMEGLKNVFKNYDIDCAGVYQLLIKNEQLRKKIQGGEKWE